MGLESAGLHRSRGTDDDGPKRRRWGLVAALLLLGGASASLYGANTITHNATVSEHKSFVSSSRDISSTLQLAIQHENDLSLSGAAYLAGNPNGSNEQFLQWSNSMQVLPRYPELNDFGNAVIVPASHLTSFATWAEVHPWAPLGPDGTFRVEPPGHRAYYCFGTVGEVRNTEVGAPAGQDFCATGLGPALLAARDSGRSSYEPFTVGDDLELGVSTPYYRGGGIPTTLQARKSAFLGWFGVSIVPDVLLDRALLGYPDIAVTMEYRAGTAHAAFTAGSVDLGAPTLTTDLHNGWTVITYGAVAAGGLLANGTAVALLLAGLALSVLLASLVLVLATGRERALHLVGEKTEELSFQALHDPLTGLPNRLLIVDRIDQMLARSRRSHLSGAVMFLDLDDFKDINDTMGHRAGDQLLISVGARLETALREGDTVGRLGGDEFVLLIEGASLTAGVEVVADRVLDVLKAPFRIEDSDLPLSISASIGIATGDELSPGELLRDADIALYRAKVTGKQRAVVFSSAMQVAAQDHRHLDVDLYGALQANEFFLVYQPTIDLGTNALTGVEALLRWRHPARGVVQPDDFIPALEASGLIVPVGAWVLHEACRQGAIWHADGRDFTVSVNVSARQLERDRIVDDVESALRLSGFDPSKLILELTETTLMHDFDATVARLGLLKAFGVRLAVDDFGTGYSSLAYLRKFPIDILKIDRSFVSGIASSAESAALVHTLVQLGKVLNLETIAEGVEDDDQRLRLQAESVDTGQGFLFSRPLTAAALDRFIRKFSPRSGGSARVDKTSADAQT